ncbi:MAG: MalY/PatB family protein [Campylobacterota bacterium]
MGQKIAFDKPIDRSGSNCVKYAMRQKRFGREDVLPLWVADMDFAAPEALQDALMDRAGHPVYGYTVYPDRYYKAIQTWQRRYGFDAGQEEILPVPSVVSAINIALQRFSGKGDGVIIQTPIYPPFLSAVKNNNRTLLQNPLYLHEGRYEIDFLGFEKAAREAKIFILCNPHNPSGRVFEPDEMRRMAAICKKHDVLIISDEIHSDIVYDAAHHPMALYAPNRTITLNAPSKTFSITGLSNAYAIIQNDSLRRAMKHALDTLGFHIANPFSIEALIAAYEDGGAYTNDLLAYLRQNRELLLQELTGDIKAIKPEGTFLCWLDCRGLKLDDKALKEYWINDLGLGLNAGTEFGDVGSGFMRLNFATAKANLQTALSRIRRG